MGLAQTRSSSELIISWNNMFPLDRWWRDKYKVALFSDTHLALDPVSQLLEYVEEQEFLKFASARTLSEAKKKLLDDGQWLTPRDLNGKIGFTETEFNDFDMDNIILE